MLEQARRRASKEGWENVELVHSDALQYTFPPLVDGILSTFALSLIPKCRQVLCNGANALGSGGRWVVLDLQVPEGWPKWLVSMLVPIVRPFAVTDEWITRRPWETIHDAMAGCLSDVSITELYLGIPYIASGAQKHEG